MAFPIVESVVSNATEVSSTDNIVSLPSGIEDGDLLIVFISTSGNEISSHSGWTLEKENPFTIPRGFILSKIADGTEGSTATFTFSNSKRYSNIVYRITNHEEIEVANFLNGTLDPPSLSPAWGEADTLWLVFGGNLESAFTTIDSAPTNYSNFTKIIGDSIAASAERFLRTITENPGAFGSSGPTDDQVVTTLAIKGSPQNTGNFLAFM